MDIELTIPFEWPVNNMESVEEQQPKYIQRAQFWDSPTTFDWFKARGYTLYKRYVMDEEELEYYPDQFTPRIPDDDDYVKAIYPHAHHHTIPHSSENRTAEHTFAKLAFAQDTNGHHVVIKLVLKDSDEFRIFKILKQEGVETLKQNSMLSILDILTIERFCFVVMPRWGDDVMRPRPDSLGEMLEIVRDLLKGLCFLHSKDIVHRDISGKNFLVNCFTEPRPSSNSKRQQLREAGELRYVIFDFDISMIVPDGVDRANFRLPYWKVLEGSYPQPHDVSHGQPDYDPFAFDVGCLGVIFCHQLQQHCGDLPFLAPLLDGMTMRNTSRRFTAQQALDFFYDRVSELTNDALLKIYGGTSDELYDHCDRWKDVPIPFLQHWVAYREAPVPFSIRFLRWLCSFETLGRFIPYVRWHLRQMLPY